MKPKQALLAVLACTTSYQLPTSPKMSFSPPGPHFMAREAPVGTLATKTMPKHKDAKTAAAQAQHKKTFDAWMRTTLHAKVRPGSAGGWQWNGGMLEKS